MPNLPINISNAAPAPASPKQPGIDSTNQQSEQGFSHVLARQVSDSGKQPPASPSSEDKGKHAEEPENTEASSVIDTTTMASSDMLATLIVQQNNTFEPQSNAHPQFAPEAPGNITQAGQNIPDSRSKKIALPASAGFNSDDKMNTGQLPGAVLETIPGLAPGKPDITITGKSEIAEDKKMSISKEMGKDFNFITQRGNLISELAPSAQQYTPSLPPVAAPSNSTTISTPFSQPGWGDEFGQTITWMATQRNQSAELHLNPPQLGPLDVSLKMNGDQATALFTSPHAAVRDAIEQAMPRLREMLAENGIMLSNAMVSDQSAKNNQDNAPRKSSGRSFSEPAENAIDVTGIPETRISSISRHQGMVDTFA